jgi:hypothetical protein
MNLVDQRHRRALPKKRKSDIDSAGTYPGTIRGQLPMPARCRRHGVR